MRFQSLNGVIIIEYAYTLGAADIQCQNTTAREGKEREKAEKLNNRGIAEGNNRP